MIGSIQHIVDEFFLEQLINEPTHEDGNILDLIFTNNVDLLHSFTCNETSFSDHHIINCKCNYNQTETIAYATPSSEEKSFESLNFFSDEIEWDKLSEELSTYPWEQELSTLDNHPSMITKFTTVCYEICKKLVPIKKPKTASSKLKIPRYRRTLMKRRTKVHKQLKQKHLSNRRRTRLKQELIEIELSLTTDYCKERQTQEALAVSAIKSNSKHFFSYEKSLPKHTWVLVLLSDRTLNL